MKLSDLKRLAIFGSVVDQGSFAAAARRLHLARSAVSEQVAALEASLGKRLLNRTTRQMALTPEGREIYERARTLNTVITDLAALSNSEAPRGRVRITTTHDFADKWLIPRLAVFNTRYPEIRFDLILSESPIDLIKTGIDLAIRIGRPRDASLVTRPISRENPLVIASREYIKERGMPATVEDLPSHTWILMEQLNTNNGVTLSGPDGTREFLPSDYHLTDSPQTARIMIEAGMGIGFHLPTLVEKQLKNGALKTILPEWREEQLTYSVVYPSRRFVPMRTRYVIDHLLS